RGNPEQIEQIRSVLKDIGEDGIPRPKKRANDGTIRIPLGGRDPDEFLDIFKSMWQGPRANPIIIRIPSESSPVKDSILPGRRLDEGFRSGTKSDDAARQPAKSFRRTTTQTVQDRNYAFTSLFQEGDEGDDLVNQLNSRLSGTVETPQSAGASDPEKPELLLTVQGDTLVVLSRDDEALSRAEEMMELLNQTMPAQSRWTVFYLTSADCTETAAMLEQLFPTSSIGTGAGGGDSMLGSVGAGLSSFGSSLMDMTGLNSIGTGPQTLRIIPETRSNSLWVTGPKYLVNQVEAMLTTLDQSELPQSQRELLPRQAIHLKYANATTVGNKIKELFKTYTEAQRAQGGGGNNPLAMMMGGGGGGGQNRGTPVRLSITIDESTNRIYCACSNQLYEQIREVAEAMDRDTQLAKPGIKVKVLKNANALAAARMIQSMMPRVTVNSGDGNNRRAGSTNSTSQDAAAKAAADRAAAFQRAAAAGAFGGRGGAGARGGNTGRGTFGGGGRGGGGGGGRGGRGR
ncbi:MAG: secretin N-terminal domain-containing protein, partial [Planctomycetaceae bacterium]